MEQLKFTQAVKDNWIQKLESGEYKQGFGGLVLDEYENDMSFRDVGRQEGEQLFHCCIGVLGDCTPGLDNFYISAEHSPYTFLDDTIGTELKQRLYVMNDDHFTRPEAKDYSNVLEFIKTLPVQED